MERIEPLLIGDYKIIQDDLLGCFTEDGVLLSKFAAIKPSWRVLDMGTGNGIIALICHAMYHGSYAAIDINPAQIALAKRSAKMNNQSIDFVCMDWNDAPNHFGHGSFDCIVCNPPYFKDGDEAENPSRAVARHQSEQQLNGLLRSAFLLLKNGGVFYLCYPSSDMVLLLSTLHAHRLEPKVMSLPRKSLMLLKCKKLAGVGLVII